MGHGLIAVVRVMARPLTGLGLRKVPGQASVQPPEIFIAATHHQHRRRGWHGLRHPSPDAFGEMLVLGLRAAPVWVPGLTPLLLEPRAVRHQQLFVLAGRYELAERRLAEVVNEHVLGADEPEPLV